MLYIASNESTSPRKEGSLSLYITSGMPCRHMYCRRASDIAEAVFYFSGKKDKYKLNISAINNPWV